MSTSATRMRKRKADAITPAEANPAANDGEPGAQVEEEHDQHAQERPVKKPKVERAKQERGGKKTGGAHDASKTGHVEPDIDELRDRAIAEHKQTLSKLMAEREHALKEMLVLKRGASLVTFNPSDPQVIALVENYHKTHPLNLDLAEGVQEPWSDDEQEKPASSKPPVAQPSTPAKATTPAAAATPKVAKAPLPTTPASATPAKSATAAVTPTQAKPSAAQVPAVAKPTAASPTVAKVSAPSPVKVSPTAPAKVASPVKVAPPAPAKASPVKVTSPPKVAAPLKVAPPKVASPAPPKAAPAPAKTALPKQATPPPTSPPPTSPMKRVTRTTKPTDEVPPPAPEPSNKVTQAVAATIKAKPAVAKKPAVSASPAASPSVTTPSKTPVAQLPITVKATAATSPSGAGPLMPFRRRAAFPWTETELFANSPSIFDLPTPMAMHQAWRDRAKQDAHALEKYSMLQIQGKLTHKRLQPAIEPPRNKTHWDYTLKEMAWMAEDFKQDRGWRMDMAKKLARAAKKFHVEKARQIVRVQKDREKSLRDKARWISRQVTAFWHDVEELIAFKHQSSIDKHKKIAMDKNLDFFVQQTEQYSASLAIDLQGSASVPNKDSAEATAEPSRTATPATASTPAPGDTATPKKPVSDVGMDLEVPDDEEFEAKDEVDDEDTIAAAEEEIHEEQLNDLKEAGHADETSMLQHEADMPIEEILKRYTPAPGAEDQETEASDNESVSGDEESGESDADSERSDEDAAAKFGADFFARVAAHDPVATEQQHQNDKERLQAAAAEAQTLQPTGFTLATTQVKTPVPFLLQGTLREYQHIGLEWMVTMYDKRLNGILADEMGLGKTIMTISLLAHLACNGHWGPHLIVVPTSVLLNWEMELKRWCPQLKVLTYFGTPRQRKQKRTGWTKPNAFHVCLTSYKMVLQDAQSFKRMKWFYLILDEAHNIKNYKSQSWQTLLNFRTRRRLLLTGTPLQNNLMELWALMHFLMPHIFQSHKEFKDWFSNPVNSMIEGTSNYSDDLIRRLHSILRPFMLRRLKKDVEKQLPGKFEHIVMCKLSKRQRLLYDEFMASGNVQNTLRGGNYLGVANVLMQLRKVCNHPDLFEGRAIVSPFDQVGLQYFVPSPIVHLLSSKDAFQASNILIHRPQPMDSEAAYSEGNHLLADKAKLKGARRPPGLLADVLALKQTSQRVQHLPAIGTPYSLQTFTPYTAKTTPVYIPKTSAATPTFLAHLASGAEPLPGPPRKAASPAPSFTSEPTVTKVPSTRLSLLAQMNQTQCEKRVHEAEDRLGHFAYVNDLRSKSQPLVVAKETVDLLLEDVAVLKEHALALRASPARFLDYSAAANSLVLSPYERLEQMQEVIENFVCYIPKARAPPIQLTTVRDMEPSSTEREHALAEELRNEIDPKLDLMHAAHVRTQIYFPDKRLIQFDCGKLQSLALMLRQLKRDGHRCLIFTQMTRMLDVLEAFINLHGYTYLRLDGATKVEQRQKMMERFNHDKRVFLFILSTRSGGLGINLVGADTVIFYDTDWNPAMDAQAQDRCHRIGQTREVHIYRLISEHTIEENILKKAKQKRQLDNIIKEGNFTTDFFKKVDIREMVKESLGKESSDASMDVDKPANGDILIPGSAAAAEQEERADAFLDNPDMEAALLQAEDAADVEAFKTLRREIAQDQKIDDQEGNEEDEAPEWESQLSAVHKLAMRYVELVNPSLDKNALAYAHQQIAEEEAVWKDQTVKRLKMGARMWSDEEEDSSEEDEAPTVRRSKRTELDEEEESEEEEEEDEDDKDQADDDDEEKRDDDDEAGGAGSGPSGGGGDSDGDDDQDAADADDDEGDDDDDSNKPNGNPKKRKRNAETPATDTLASGLQHDELSQESPMFYEVTDMREEATKLYPGASLYEVPYGLVDFDQEEIYLPPSAQLPSLLEFLSESSITSDYGEDESSEESGFWSSGQPSPAGSLSANLDPRRPRFPSDLDDAARACLYLRPISDIARYKELVDLRREKLLESARMSTLFIQFIQARAFEGQHIPDLPESQRAVYAQLNPLVVPTWTQPEDACILDTIREYWTEDPRPEIPWLIIVDALRPLAPFQTPRTPIQVLARWYDHLLPKQAAAIVRMDYHSTAQFRITPSVRQRLMQLLPPSWLVLESEYKPVNFSNPGTQAICHTLDTYMDGQKLAPSTFAATGHLDKISTRQGMDAVMTHRAATSTLPDLRTFVSKAAPGATKKAAVAPVSGQFDILNSVNPMLVFGASQKLKRDPIGMPPPVPFVVPSLDPRLPVTSLLAPPTMSPRMPATPSMPGISPQPPTAAAPQVPGQAPRQGSLSAPIAPSTAATHPPQMAPGPYHSAYPMPVQQMQPRQQQAPPPPHTMPQPAQAKSQTPQMLAAVTFPPPPSFASHQQQPMPQPQQPMPQQQHNAPMSAQRATQMPGPTPTYATGAAPRNMMRPGAVQNQPMSLPRQQTAPTASIPPSGSLPTFKPNATNANRPGQTMNAAAPAKRPPGQTTPATAPNNAQNYPAATPAAATPTPAKAGAARPPPGGAKSGITIQSPQARSGVPAATPSASINAPAGPAAPKAGYAKQAYPPAGAQQQPMMAVSPPAHISRPGSALTASVVSPAAGGTMTMSAAQRANMSPQYAKQTGATPSTAYPPPPQYVQSQGQLHYAPQAQQQHQQQGAHPGMAKFSAQSYAQGQTAPAQNYPPGQAALYRQNAPSPYIPTTGAATTAPKATAAVSQGTAPQMLAAATATAGATKGVKKTVAATPKSMPGATPIAATSATGTTAPPASVQQLAEYILRMNPSARQHVTNALQQGTTDQERYRLLQNLQALIQRERYNQNQVAIAKQAAAQQQKK